MAVERILFPLTYWIRWIHIFTAAPVLLLMVLFSVTGLLLNHQQWFLGEVKTLEMTEALPDSIASRSDLKPTQLALPILVWLDEEHGIRGVSIDYEWDDMDELLLIHLDGPSGAHSVEVSPEEESVTVFSRQLPVAEAMNNLHRGKHVSPLWRLLIDISAICMLFFSLSGLWLTIVNQRFRVSALTAVLTGLFTSALAIYLMY